MQKIEFIKCETLHGSTPSELLKNSHIRYRKCIHFCLYSGGGGMASVTCSFRFVSFHSVCVPILLVFHMRFIICMQLQHQYTHFIYVCKQWFYVQNAREKNTYILPLACCVLFNKPLR